jgi:prophage maintenance system killer protein
VTKALTFEHLLAIAEELPGDPEFDDYSILDAALARMASHHMGRDVLASHWLKAAALLETIAQLKPLASYNSVYAWMATETYLRLNAIEISYKPAEAVALTADVEAGQATVVQIAARLRAWAT